MAILGYGCFLPLSWEAQIRKNVLLFCASYCVSTVPRPQPEAVSCVCLLRGTWICLCSVCNAHRDGLLIMLQARWHSTTGIMNCPTPAQTSHTVVTKETYLCLALLSCALPCSSPALCPASGSASISPFI